MLIENITLPLSQTAALNYTHHRHCSLCCASADGFHVPSIQPLETLHNALTLRQVEHFIKNVTDMHCRTPPLCITPSTPPQSQQPTQLSLHPVHLTVPSLCQPPGTSVCLYLYSQQKKNKEKMMEPAHHVSICTSVFPVCFDSDFKTNSF